MDRILGCVSELKQHLVDLVSRYVPFQRYHLINQGLSFEPTWKALPTCKLAQSVLYNRLKLPWERVKRVKSSFVCFPYELAGWQWLVCFTHARGDLWSQGVLWPQWVRYVRL